MTRYDICTKTSNKSDTHELFKFPLFSYYKQKNAVVKEVFLTRAETARNVVYLLWLLRHNGMIIIIQTNLKKHSCFCIFPTKWNLLIWKIQFSNISWGIKLKLGCSWLFLTREYYREIFSCGFNSESTLSSILHELYNQKKISMLNQYGKSSK